MSILYIALPVALILAIIAVIVFVVQVRSGQFDDLETPPRRMLYDDIEQTPTESLNVKPAGVNALASERATQTPSD